MKLLNQIIIINKFKLKSNKDVKILMKKYIIVHFNNFYFKN